MTIQRQWKAGANRPLTVGRHCILELPGALYEKFFSGRFVRRFSDVRILVGIGTLVSFLSTSHFPAGFATHFRTWVGKFYVNAEKRKRIRRETKGEEENKKQENEEWLGFCRREGLGFKHFVLICLFISVLFPCSSRLSKILFADIFRCVLLYVRTCVTSSVCHSGRTSSKLK